MTKKKYRKHLIIGDIKHLFDYNPTTGVLCWKERINPAIKHNRICCTNSHGYTVVRVNKKLYGAHRIIWLLMTGKWPKTQIDHINRIRNDNRWCNLREANKKENVGNSKIFSHNTSGYRGVSFDKSRNKWSAFIYMNGKKKHIGRFVTKEEAKAAYDVFAKEHFGVFYNE